MWAIGETNSPKVLCASKSDCRKLYHIFGTRPATLQVCLNFFLNFTSSPKKVTKKTPETLKTNLNVPIQRVTTLHLVSYMWLQELILTYMIESFKPLKDQVVCKPVNNFILNIFFLLLLEAVSFDVYSSTVFR